MRRDNVKSAICELDTPEHSYSAHHNSSSFLVKTHSDVLNTWWLNPVSCACCDSYSPLTAGMLVLCDELYATSSTLGDWCCVLTLKEKEITKCHFPFVSLDDQIPIPFLFPKMHNLNDMMLMANSVSRLDESNPVLWLATRAGKMALLYG